MNFLTASHAGTGFYIVGVLQLATAWSFFRHPGVSFWPLCAPVWRASRYPEPAGVALWVSSINFMLVGFGLLLYRSGIRDCVP